MTWEPMILYLSSCLGRSHWLFLVAANQVGSSLLVWHQGDQPTKTTSKSQTGSSSLSLHSNAFSPPDNRGQQLGVCTRSPKDVFSQRQCMEFMQPFVLFLLLRLFLNLHRRILDIQVKQDGENISAVCMCCVNTGHQVWMLLACCGTSSTSDW